MFVTKSTHRKLELKYLDALTTSLAWRTNFEQLKEEYKKLTAKWNDLVERVNSKGGESFLDSAPILSEDDIKKLLQLCHPDKHEGKQLAVDMTHRLLELRKLGK